MNLIRIVADCSFVERESAIKECIEIAKTHKTTVELTVYKDCLKNKVVLTLNKNSKEDKVLRYIGKQIKDRL